MKSIKNCFIQNKKLILSLLLVLIFYKLIIFIPAYLGYYYTFYLKKFDPQILLNFWNNWDAGWYLSVAQSGYNGNNVSFFPLYPFLIKLFSFLFDFRLAAYLINFLALFGALLGLNKLVKIDHDDETAWRTIIYLLLFPTAIFLTAFYNESLFLFLAIWTVYWSRKKNWLYAALFAFFAGLARIEGSVLFIYLTYEYLQQNDYKLKNIKKDILYCLAPLGGLAVYMIFLYFKFGDPIKFLHVIGNWDKKFSWPWDSFGNYFSVFFSFDIATTGYYLSRVIDLFFMIIALIMGCLVLTKERMSYGIYVILSILMVSFTSDLSSANRKTLLLFPVLILLAKWGKNQIVNFVIIFLFSTLFTFFTMKFVNGQWAG